MEEKSNLAHRKVFISFLGTTDYKICNYYFDGDENNRVCNVRHVQEAIVGHECKGWSENDRILIFLTKAARANNWESGTYKPNGEQKIGDLIDEPANLKVGDAKWGLKEQLHKLAEQGFFPESIVKDEHLDSEGFSEDEIWNIFNTIESKIEENDEIYFDFTNGFRNLPMLGMVLLTYLKNTKNITIGEIYYGAFEKLGPAYKVNTLPMDKRNAPVLRLKSFSNIMDFSTAAGVFAKYGNALQLCDVIDRTWLKKKNMEGESNDVILNMKKMMNPLKNKLERITKMLQSCRGLEIVSGENVNDVRNYIQTVVDDDTEKNGPKQALNPILSIIRRKFEEFDGSKNLMNGIVAARWCYDNGMIQQSLTIMQETLVSICMDMLGEDYTEKSGRMNMGTVMQNLNYSQNSRETEEEKKNIAEKIDRLKKCFSKDLQKSEDILHKLGSCYSALTKLRNDVNHAGFDLEDNQRKAKRQCGKDGLKLISDVGKMFDNHKEVVDSIKVPEKADKLELFLNGFGDVLSSNYPLVSEKDKNEILDAYETMYRKFEFVEIRLQQLGLGEEILTRPSGFIDNETKMILNSINEYLQYMNIAKDASTPKEVC